jgi:uncharacterized protein YegP (UPF0339 family)
MSNPKNKPGIHVYYSYKSGEKKWYWRVVAPNGRVTANNQTYSRKSIALNGIRSTAVTLGGPGKFKYYDHSKPESPLTSYL